jgi:hypothetical protein
MVEVVPPVDWLFPCRSRTGVNWSVTANVRSCPAEVHAEAAIVCIDIQLEPSSDHSGTNPVGAWLKLASLRAVMATSATSRQLPDVAPKS